MSEKISIKLAMGEWEDVVDACSTWERDYAMPADGDWPGRGDRRLAIARLRDQVNEAKRIHPPPSQINDEETASA